ncbi:hypothetical protein WA577_004070 [Blastocystis sp. JDR]
MDVLRRDLEEKDRLVEELQSRVSDMSKQLQMKCDEVLKLQSRLVSVVSERDEAVAQSKGTGANTSLPLTVTFQEKTILEEKSKLELDMLVVKKENATLKEHNHRLGELVLQRDGCIERQRKEIERLTEELKGREKEKVEKEEQQRLNRVLKEEAVHHAAELQQARVLWLALQQELARCRQEKELAEKECVRVECALQKAGDTAVQLQQEAAEAAERRNRLAVLLDDCRREVRLLEGRSAEAADKAAKVQLDMEAERLQHQHWENLARGEAERYALLLGEFEAVKADHKRLFIRYMDVKSDNERLQRQCRNLASDAELARASVLTYKGRVVKNEKGFEELLKENVYLTSMLKQKEGQLEAAERSWQEKLQQVLRQAQGDDDEESTLPSASLPPAPAVGDVMGGVTGAMGGMTNGVTNGVMGGVTGATGAPTQPMVVVMRDGEA